MCAGRRLEQRLAHFYSLITFTGPQSHLRNHGDADKVTHDYSSIGGAWLDSPREPCKTYSSALPVCLLYLNMPLRRKHPCLCLFLTLTSCLHLTSHLSPLLSNYLSSLHVPPIRPPTGLFLFSNPVACSPPSVSVDEDINHRHMWHEVLLISLCPLLLLGNCARISHRLFNHSNNFGVFSD